MNEIKANARKRTEQDVNLVPMNMKQKNLSQPHEEVLITTDSRYKHYEANEDRIILRNYFREKERQIFNYYQLLIPKHLVNEELEWRIWKTPMDHHNKH